jgi:hypothetical protein
MEGITATSRGTKPLSISAAVSIAVVGSIVAIVLCV